MCPLLTFCLTCVKLWRNIGNNNYYYRDNPAAYHAFPFILVTFPERDRDKVTDK